MKLVAAIAIHVPAEDILRELRFFERIRRAFGGKPDLRTGRVRASIEATMIVEAARDALRSLGVTNAISLSVDDTTLFHDRESKPDDLGDLLVAFHENESVFGQGFRELRLAVEHREAGLHLVVEITARSEHATKAPTVRIVVSGRVAALAPLPGEDADAYRTRTQPLVKDAAAFTGYELQFKSFVDRLRDAVAASLPVGRVEIEATETRIVRPSDKPATPAETDRASRAYDPYDHYYPGYFATSAMLDMMIWSMIFSSAFHPHYVVVDSANHFQGHTDDKGIESGPTAEAGDASHWNEADSTPSTDDNTVGTNEDSMTDSNDHSDGGGDSGGDAGGDFGGGDDGGGFDFSFD